MGLGDIAAAIFIGTNRHLVGIVLNLAVIWVRNWQPNAWFGSMQTAMKTHFWPNCILQCN